jgi:hypothetical protein
MAEPRKPLGPEELEAIHADYDDRSFSVGEVCTRNEVSRAQLYWLVRSLDWRRRSPKAVDKHDLTQRLLRLLEDQVRKLEKTMMDNEKEQSAVLGKLSATLDRLIATDRATAPRRRPARESKLIEEIRQKVAERLAQLDED